MFVETITDRKRRASARIARLRSSVQQLKTDSERAVSERSKQQQSDAAKAESETETLKTELRKVLPSSIPPLLSLLPFRLLSVERGVVGD